LGPSDDVVAVDGLLSVPADPDPDDILPMNHAGTHPLSPVSVLILRKVVVSTDHDIILTSKHPNIQSSESGTRTEECGEVVEQESKYRDPTHV
jgi:hypothetical protein